MKKLFLLLLFSGCAHSVERVTAFHSDIRIAPSGTLTVTETIEVQAEGKHIRRGILRDFPTHYRDRYGNRVTVPLEVLKVTRNGEPEDFALERLANGTRIRIGEANRLLATGKHVYRILYSTARQIGFFGDHDELYWNVNGTGWTFTFDRITAEVTLPERVPAGDIKVEAFTGPQGARGHDFNAFVRHGSAAFRASRPLAPGEAMTISVAFPKGVVAQPFAAARAGWFLADNKGIAAGIAALVLMFAFLFACWWRYGRDPKPGPAFPRYEPPAGLGPAGVRFIDRHGYDERCFAAALLGLGSRGYLKIRQFGERYRVERTGKEVEWLPGEQELARHLLRDQAARVDIGKQHDPAVQAARDSFSEALKAYFGRRYWSSNSAAACFGAAIGIVGAIAMYALDTPGWVMAALIAAMLATLIVFAWRLLPVYSVQGRKLQDEIDGLRQYLSVAEADELARLKAPPQTREEFSRFLPYAVALGVEKTWAERFAAVLGAAAVAAAVSEFYQSGDSSSGDSVRELADSISDMGGTIASASTPPGSSDGGSGGGSSGGGGGGGGSGW